MKRIVVVGAGGHGQVVVDILLSTAKATGNFSIVGFVDDDTSLQGRSYLGINVLGPIKSLPNISHDGVVVAIGDNAARSKTTSALFENGEILASAIHPHAVLGTDVQIGTGSMVCAGVIINMCAEIGQGTILNTGSTVDHHCVIGPFCHIAPGVHLGGEVVIGEGALIGIGTSVLPRCRIGAWSVVGGGATVIKDVPDGWTVAGVPARRIRSKASTASDGINFQSR